MSHYPVGIGTLNTGLIAPAARGRFVQDRHRLARIHHAKRLQGDLRVAAQVNSPSAVSQPSQAPPQQRPAPPPLERAGDLPGRLLRDYLSGWTSQYTEYDYYVPPEAVYGTIPEEIKGTLFLIGPGLTEVYGTSVRYPSDADGMVCSLAFGDGGQIFFRNRYVRTRSFATEQALGRRVTRGLHDRGAPAVTGQQPPQQQHNHRRHDNQAGASQPAGAAAVAGSRRSSSKGRSGGRLPAAPSDFDSEFDEEFDFEYRSGGDSSGGQQWAAAASSPESNGARPSSAVSRLDPLALLGLPPLPPLSSLFNPIDTSFRAPANASIVLWAGRLLAFTEGGSLPYELNKLSLETVGQYDAVGAMADIGRIVGGYKIAPAPPQGPAGGRASRPQRLVLMGTAQSGPDTLVRWAEVGEDGGLAAPPTTYRLLGCSALGVLDFWVTDSHYVVVQGPLDFNPQRFVTRATIGATSFVECFDWDPSRPARIHLVARPTPASIAAAAAAASRPRSPRDPIVWPPKGPDAVIVDAPPLLPISCVGCYSLADNDRVLVLDALCQQGLSGSHGGLLDSLDPEEHKHQTKPELTRLVVELGSGTAAGTGRATARVLSQCTTVAATTAAAFATATTAAATAAKSGSSASSEATSAMATAARSVAPPPLAPVGNGGSFRGGYHHLYAAASANDTAASWAPPQVLLKLSVQPDYGTPAAVTTSSTAAQAGGDGVWAPVSPMEGLARRRGVGAEVWTPGDRVFVGPPVFIPRATDGTGASPDDTGTGGAPAGRPLSEVLGTGSPLPPLESELEAAAWRAAMAAAAQRQQEEQDGWLLVMLVDVEAMAAELCILDARDVTRGPVAVVALPHHLPHVRHAHFTKAYCGPGLAAPPGWRPRSSTRAAPSDKKTLPLGPKE